MKNINNIELYRLTHIDNIPHILKYGITHKDSSNNNPKYKNIGDISLITKRSSKQISVSNGEDKIVKEINLGDFIPFYFDVKMPMLYVIQHGGNNVEKPTNAKDIIYLVCKLEELLKLNQEYYFTNGHATDNLTTFYDKTKINEINTILDWQCIESKYWGRAENAEIKWKKQAEFLIKGDIPPTLIDYFICYNNSIKKKLVNFGISEQNIKIDQNAYF
jgi:hypothetical protein